MQVRGKLINATRDFASKKAKLTFLIEDSINSLEEIENVSMLDINLSKHKEKRKLDANAYCWLLIGKLAEKLNIKPVEVYREHIKDSAVYEIVPVKDEAIDRFSRSWESKGLGWQVVDIGESKFRGFHNLQVFYGSSSYNTKEMSQLINNIVEDCKVQGIETKSPQELQSLLESWEENDKKSKKTN